MPAHVGLRVRPGLLNKIRIPDSQLVRPNQFCSDGCNHRAVPESPTTRANETRVVVVAQCPGIDDGIRSSQFIHDPLNLTVLNFKQSRGYPPTMQMEKLDVGLCHGGVNRRYLLHSGEPGHWRFGPESSTISLLLWESLPARTP